MLLAGIASKSWWCLAGCYWWWGVGRIIPGGLGRWGVVEGEVAWRLGSKGELGHVGGHNTRGPSKICWKPRGKGPLHPLIRCGSNTGLRFSRISVQCPGHFVPDSQLLTRVAIKSEVRTNEFTRSQPVTPVFVECLGRRGGLPREQMPLKPGLGRHFLPGSHVYEGQLLASGMQALALETANFCTDTAQVPRPVQRP